MAYKTDSKLFD